MYGEVHEEDSLLGVGQSVGKDYGDVMTEDHPYFHLYKDKLTKLAGLF
jgi:hypothetical protein